MRILKLVLLLAVLAPLDVLAVCDAGYYGSGNGTDNNCTRCPTPTITCPYYAGASIPGENYLNGDCFNPNICTYKCSATTNGQICYYQYCYYSSPDPNNPNGGLYANCTNTVAFTLNCNPGYCTVKNSQICGSQPANGQYIARDTEDIIELPMIGANGDSYTMHIATYKDYCISCGNYTDSDGGRDAPTDCYRTTPSPSSFTDTAGSGIIEYTDDKCYYPNT